MNHWCVGREQQQQVRLWWCALKFQAVIHVRCSVRWSSHPNVLSKNTTIWLMTLRPCVLHICNGIVLALGVQGVCSLWRVLELENVVCRNHTAMRSLNNYNGDDDSAFIMFGQCMDPCRVGRTGGMFALACAWTWNCCHYYLVLYKVVITP